MNTMNRVLFLVATNAAIMLVMAMIAGIIYLVLPLFHVDVSAFSNIKIDALWAVFTGVIITTISLFTASFMAKRIAPMRELLPSQEDKSHIESIIIEAVLDLSKREGITPPSIWIYESDEPNAFTTGRSKNHAMLAMSTGLLHRMNDPQVRSIIAHEFGHISSGDVVTSILIQGVFNVFAMFIASVCTEEIYKESFILGLISTVLIEMAFMVIAAIPLAYFSRIREFSADAYSARMYGKEGMIDALNGLEHAARQMIVEHGKKDYDHSISEISRDTLATSKIISATSVLTNAKKSWFKSLYASHPTTKSRIEALQKLDD